MLLGRESVFKFGVHVPKNDGEANKSPERVQWLAGRTLEWLRLKKVEAFDGTWTKARIRKELPTFQLTDIVMFSLFMTIRSLRNVVFA